MEDIVGYISIIASLIALGSTAYLLRYSPVLSKASHEYKESSKIVEGILSELNSRLLDQDKRIADLMVKVDVLEDRWFRSGLGMSRRFEGGNVMAHEQDSIRSTSRSLVEEPEIERALNYGERSYAERRMEKQSSIERPRRIGKIGLKIMQRLSQGPMTAPGVKDYLQSSREHAARLMKSLHEQGLVIRDESKKPYMYSLSDAGSDVVTKGT